MRQYNEIWASGVYESWLKSSPRVNEMVLEFIAYFRDYGYENPEILVRKKIVSIIRQARSDSKWPLIKKAVDHRIMWRVIAMEHLAPPGGPPLPESLFLELDETT